MPLIASKTPQTVSLVCRLCAQTQQWRRTFSSTPIARVIGPESPRYIDLPEPPQTPKPAPNHIKGILPVPRKLFGHKRNTRYKTSTIYLDQTAPEPITTSSAQGPEAPRIQWRQRMAALRRANFKQGIAELASRRESIDGRNTYRQSLFQRRKRALINAPERDDERLTNPSLTPEVRALLQLNEPRGRTAKEFVRARQNYARHVARQSTRRKEALHNLYLHARTFILTEEQLNQEVEKTFGSDEDPIVWGPMHDQTVWGLGPPATVEKMLKKGSGTSTVEGLFGRRQESVIQTRLKRIAEVLTGGKLDSPNPHTV